jgi:hypothetical protein
LPNSYFGFFAAANVFEGYVGSGILVFFASVEGVLIADNFYKRPHQVHERTDVGEKSDLTLIRERKTYVWNFAFFYFCVNGLSRERLKIGEHVLSILRVSYHKNASYQNFAKLLLLY